MLENSRIENLKNYYNKEAKSRNASTKQDWKIKVRDSFYDLLKQENKKTLLELGAGAGYDSLFFMDKGLQVIAIDLSHEMVNNCKDKHIEAYELDFYNLKSLNRKFDCVWAMNTLLHVPKTDLGDVLNQVDSVLLENGLFYMGVYGGEDTESEYVRSEISETPRFFSYHSMDSLKIRLAEYFQIISFNQFEVSRKIEKHIFQSVVMRKK